MVKDTVLYERLGVSSNASQLEIKKGYGTMSKKWHPDKNLGNKEHATKKFQEINQAKEILLDEEKRKIYDQVGMEIFKITLQEDGNDEQTGGFPGFGGMPGMNNFHFSSNFGNARTQVQECQTQ